MSVSVSMPQLGESVTEGTVTRWLKREGDRVEADEPLLEVSTDKVDTEIPSPVSGVLRGITVAADETVAVGAELAVIDDGSSADGKAGQAAQAPAEQADQARASQERPGEQASQEQASQEQASQEQASQEQPVRASAGSVAAPPSDDSSSAEQAAGEGTRDAGSTADYDTAAFRSPGYQGQPAGAPSYAAWQSPQQQQPYQQPGYQPYEQQPYQQQPYQQPGYQPSGYQPGAGQGQSGSPALAGQPGVPGGAPSADDSEPSFSGPEGPYVTPLVRKLAAEHGIDLAAVAGTGVGGRIRKQDVLDAATARRGQAATFAQQPVPQQPYPQQPYQQQRPGPQQPDQQQRPVSQQPYQQRQPIPQQPYQQQQPVPQQPYRQQPVAPPFEGVPGPAAARPGPAAAARQAAATDQAESRPDIVPSRLRGTTERMSRSRQVIAQRMVESLQTSAQLTTVVEADVTAIARLRERAKAGFEASEGVKLTFLPFFALAAVEALKVHPRLNAVVDAANAQVTYHDAEHLGIAVDTERGLMVPVIRKAGDLNIAGLARKIADIAQRTRAGQVSPDELSGGTFTLTNTGSRGALFDTPIINQPQVAILGTGTVVKRPVVVDDLALGEVITVRSMVYLALTYDHRLVDGADAARFLATMKNRLQEGAFETGLGL